MRVLLVDDDVRFLDALAALLATLPGVEIVDRAFDGASGVRATELLRPDVVLLDLAMPGMDGVQAARLMHDRAPDSKVVILSGSDVEDHARQLQSAGAYAYIRKTHTVTDLPELLRGISH